MSKKNSVATVAVALIETRGQCGSGHDSEGGRGGGGLASVVRAGDSPGQWATCPLLTLIPKWVMVFYYVH